MIGQDGDGGGDGDFAQTARPGGLRVVPYGVEVGERPREFRELAAVDRKAN
jgi:hypothetical protein